MKYTFYIAILGCLPLMGCGQLDRVLADDGDAVAQPVAEAPEPSALDQLEAELAALGTSVAEIEEAAAPVMDGPVPEPIAEEDATPDPVSESEASQAAVERWLMDPSLLDDPEAKHFVAVAREIAAIRQDIERLRQTMDAQMGGYYDDLQRENAELRRELRRAYAVRGGGGGQGLPMLPVDDYAMAESDALWADAAPEDIEWETPAADSDSGGAFPPLASSDPGVTALVGSSDVQYAVVAEWGRSPEEVEARGGESSSLRGMVALVPAGTSEDDLIALGQQLHSEYGDYDNVNVQIFNDAAAADTYAKTNSMEDGTPILRISKYRISGENKIYLNKDGVEVDITPAP